MFSKFRAYPDCACLWWVNSARDIIYQHGIPFSYLPWNWIRGIFPSKYRSIVWLFVWLSYTSNVRTSVSKGRTIPIILGKYASYDNSFQLILTFICCNTWASLWKKADFEAYRFYLKYSDTSSPFHTCRKIWTSPFYYMFVCLKQCKWVANSVDSDQTPCSAMSDHGLHCLLRPVCPYTLDYYGSRLWWTIY